MRADRLRSVVRQRTLAQARARRVLADRIAAESAADEAARAAQSAVWREHAAALDMDADDHAVEAFAAWLPHGRAAQAMAEEARDGAAAETARARAELAAASASLEAVEVAVRRLQAAEKHRADARREHQAAELAQRKRAGTAGGSHWR